MPSLSEAPSGGAEAFWLLLRCSKVTRRKGGTLSRRYAKNGYTHQTTPLGYRELIAYGAYGITRLCSVLR